MNEELVHRAIIMTHQGYSAAEIATRLEVTKRTVQRWRQKQGASQKRSDLMTAEQLTQAQTMLDDGASFTEIGRTLGVNRITIARHFPGQGWTRDQCIRFALEVRYLEQALGKVA